MLIGQTVLTSTVGSGATYFSPWMPRQGDSFTAVFEIMKLSGAVTLTCTVETKNAEDSDSASSDIGTVGPTAVGTATASATGCLELVRYRFEAKSTGSQEWLHFRSNPPIWQPN